MSFKEKYLKYKNKYLELKKQIGGCKNCDDPKCIEGELCENASSRFEDFLQFNDGQYVLPYLQYPEGCALGAVGPVTMAMATTVRRWDWDWLPFFVGTKGIGDGQFNWPCGIAFSSGGDIIVSEAGNHRIQVFDRFGNYVRQWGKYGSAQGQFDRPKSVAISSSVDVYVCDNGNNRIQVFDLSGNFIQTFGKRGNLDGQFDSPSSVAIYKDQVFVSDTFNFRIQVFDLNGNYLSQWGSEGIYSGRFSYPRGLAVSSAGDVFVCDHYNNRVQVFDISGTFKYSYGDSSPNQKADWTPHGVAISSTNDISSTNKVLICDSKYNRVLMFTINGTFIRYVKLPNQHVKPTGIAVSPSGLLVICDDTNHRILCHPWRKLKKI